MGMPLEGVNPIEPPTTSFRYLESDLLPSNFCSILEDLVPLPPATSPQGRSYPLSPTWNYLEDS
jgi:hypothetical protein